MVYWAIIYTLWVLPNTWCIGQLFIHCGFFLIHCTCVYSARSKECYANLLAFHKHPMVVTQPATAFTFIQEEANIIIHVNEKEG